MLKGLGEPEVAMGVIILVGGILAAFAIISIQFTYTSAIATNTNDRLDIVNSLYMARSCFSVNGIMQTSKLNVQEKEKCGLSLDVCVKDAVTGQEWLDCRKVTDSHANTYAPLQKDSDIVIGEIYV